jgi:hypothetical protein
VCVTLEHYINAGVDEHPAERGRHRDVVGLHPSELSGSYGLPRALHVFLRSARRKSFLVPSVHSQFPECFRVPLPVLV